MRFRLDWRAWAGHRFRLNAPKESPAMAMTPSDIDRVQTYLRKLLGSNRIRIVPPAKPGLSVEIAVEDEVIGTLHRDDEEGEVSYAVHLTILEEDLPARSEPEMPLRRPRR
jgi:hypothetical protein